MPRKSTLDEYRRTLSALEQGTIARVYCLFGPERTLLNDLVLAIRRAVLPSKAQAWNHDRLEASQATVESVWTALRTVPMLGGRRLVEVTDVHKWPEDWRQALAERIEQIPNTACLLLVADNLDARKKLVRACSKTGVALKLEPPRPREAAELLGQWARQLGVRIAPEATALLLEMTGGDLGVLRRALENAALYAGPEVIRPEHVAATVPDTRQALVFELADAVAERNLEKALDALKRLGKDPSAHLKALGMLARQVRLLRLAHWALARGTPPGRLAETLDVHPYVAKKLASQVRRHGPASLERAHVLLTHADLTLKSSRRDGRLVMEQLVMELCRS